MATIIDFAQAREAAAPKAQNTYHDPGGPYGEILLFTGVRYERQSSSTTPVEGAPVEASEHPTRKKKNS